MLSDLFLNHFVHIMKTERNSLTVTNNVKLVAEQKRCAVIFTYITYLCIWGYWTASFLKDGDPAASMYLDAGVSFRIVYSNLTSSIFHLLPFLWPRWSHHQSWPFSDRVTPFPVPAAHTHGVEEREMISFHNCILHSFTACAVKGGHP